MDWDLQSVGFLNSDMSLAMDSPFSFKASTGYLEDAIAGWTGRQPKLFDYTNDQMDLSMNNPVFYDQAENIASTETHSVTDVWPVKASKRIKLGETTNRRETKQQETIFSSNKDELQEQASFSMSPPGLKIVYPFDVVKPGGIEGDTTLKDINCRILKPPTKPVRHPVGDFAIHPCLPVNGFSMSGKTVTSFTKIHTRGRGSITIMWTKD